MPQEPPQPATLLRCWLEIVQPWRAVFSQQRTLLRAQRQALGALLCLGRSTLSRIIWTTGREQKSWSGEYFLHSRAQWNPHALFEPILRQALPYCPGRLVGVAVDDTRLKKTGRSIPQAQYHRDPLSPPFHVNLIWALRFLQASLLLPLHRSGPFSARGIPIRFEEVSSVKKPSRRAGEDVWKIYKQKVKECNLSRLFVQSMAAMRQAFDRAGAQKKVLVIVGDGSFCNRTVLSAIPDRVVLIARARKDASLCFRAPEGGRCFYSKEKFTPDQVRQDEKIPWQITKIFYGGKRRTVRYKEVSGVLWQGGARKRPLRLFVLAATPYKKRKSGKLYYHHPAFLLTTMLADSTRQLLQMYFDRWQIGVSSQGYIVQSVKDRPRSKGSDLVAGEAPWRESKTAEPSDKHTRKECAQRTRLQRTVNADVASLHEYPVAETVDNARKQQGLSETSPIRQLSPAGYQRRHGVKDDVETGEALGARRRNLVEEMPAITVSGKCRHRHQGGGSGRSTADGRAAKRARREGPGPVSIPSIKGRQG